MRWNCTDNKNKTSGKWTNRHSKATAIAECAATQLNKMFNEIIETKSRRYSFDEQCVLLMLFFFSPVYANETEYEFSHRILCQPIRWCSSSVHLSCWGCIKRKAHSPISDHQNGEHKRRNILWTIALWWHTPSTTNNPNKTVALKQCINLFCFMAHFLKRIFSPITKSNKNTEPKKKETNDSYFVCMTHAIKTRTLLWTQLMFQGKTGKKKVTAIQCKTYTLPSTLNFKVCSNKRKTVEQKLPHPFMIFVRKYSIFTGRPPYLNYPFWVRVWWRAAAQLHDRFEGANKNLLIVDRLKG